MKVNAGGQLAPEEVIGRDKLIQEIWRSLERQSVVLSAERRMGKTSILKKMLKEAPPTLLPLYRDLENITTPRQFAEDVYRDVEQYLSTAKKTGMRLQTVLQSLGGVQVGTLIKLPDHLPEQSWKSLLTASLADLTDNQGGKQVIFFWDEMPYMIYNIQRTSGSSAAIEVLDMLRSLRQQHPTLRMVYTGSIGLHHVLTALKKDSYANEPTNDMKLIAVPPLAGPDANQLAQALIEGENVSTDGLAETAAAVAEGCDGVAFYVQCLVDRFVQRGDTIFPSVVSPMIQECLTDPQDPWQMRHFVERLETYYRDTADLTMARAILDVLATAPKPLPFSDLFDLVKAKVVTDDSEHARKIIVTLQRDHYLRQDPNGWYRFQLPLVQLSWRLQRGLET